MSKKSPLLSVKDLHVDFTTPSGTFNAVKSVSFDIHKGETLALVGESGSGKSVSALSIMKLLPYPMASHPSGSIKFDGEELINMPDSLMQTIRGQRIGMIFQEPMTALNPLHTIEKQIAEPLLLHKKLSKSKAKVRVKELLDLVGLPRIKERLNAYPHELSGGQRQRVMIAMALANDPDLLIADEPTTALDVTIQAQILTLMKELQQKLGMAILMITHDLTVVRKMSDHVCVMKHGELVESNETEALFTNPQHDYTKMLLESEPKGHARPLDDTAPPLLSCNNIKVSFPTKRDFFGRPKEYLHAVNDVCLDVRAGETLGIVGESGSGKTTLGMALLHLQKCGGKISFDGQDISSVSKTDLLPLRRSMQVVFQDPFGSLSPRMSATQIIAEGLQVHEKNLSKSERDDRVIEAMKEVDLNPDTRHRYPHEFSGGQRQRISIARAMILKPRFVVLDEPTSALDMSVQAQVVDLLRDLQEKHNLAYLFISHDLRVVRALAHNIVVMKQGKIIETGPTESLFTNPEKSYTQTLLQAALELRL